MDTWEKNDMLKSYGSYLQSLLMKYPPCLNASNRKLPPTYTYPLSLHAGLST